MQIDIVSDTICPWCFIGKRRFEQALALWAEQRKGDLPDISIGWRPFQLNPDMPTDGADRAEYLNAKFGGAERARKIYQRVAAAGTEVGIPFDFDGIPRTPNTLASHRVIRWAASAGVQDKVVERLFRAYFTEGEDIGDHATLARLAGDCGMDANLVRELLDEGRDVELVQSEDGVARQMGIEGVPCFIVNRKYAISGAQDPAVFLQLFDLVAREEEAAAAG